MLLVAWLIGAAAFSTRRAAAPAARRRAVAADGAAVRQGDAPGRQLGAMESLFAPRRSLETCDLPATMHVACTVVDGAVGEDALRGALVDAVANNAMLSRRISGTGAPPKRGPLGSALAGTPLANLLPPFGDDNMRIGRGAMSFEAMDSTAAQIIAAAFDGAVDVPEARFEEEWREAMARAVDGAGGTQLFADPAANVGGKRFDFDLGRGPLWRLKLVRAGDRSALIFAFDHATSDQVSAMQLVTQILTSLAAPAQGAPLSAEQVASLACPPSLEYAILGDDVSRGFVDEATGGTGLLALDRGSLPYLRAKAAEKCIDPLAAASAPGAAARLLLPQPQLAVAERRAALAFRVVDKATVALLRAKAREEKTTLGSALAAAVATAYTSLLRRKGGSVEGGAVKVLQSLDMRRFAPNESRAAIDKGLACYAGSFDVLLPLKELTKRGTQFWPLARRAGGQLKDFVDSGYGQQSVRVFDWAVDAMEMARLVELEADNPLSLGRAYACGISNAGVYSGDGESSPAKARVRSMHYATSTAYAGATYQASAVTVRGDLHLTFNGPTPIVGRQDVEAFADAAVRALEKEALLGEKEEFPPPVQPPFPPLVWAAGLAAGVVPHAAAWAAFLSTFKEAVDAAETPADWINPFSFWLFFATAHPIVGTAGVGLGELAWNFPGYSEMSALDQAGAPLAFTATLLFATKVIMDSPLAKGVSQFAIAAALALSIGGGLDGGDRASYDLELGRGCPTYSAVRQSSMDGFDAQKYGGIWYEHAYHDWTQFAEVYDTTLDIRVAEDGKTWLDDFSVKGPSSAMAPTSWRGSPVANGAHYPMKGDFDAEHPNSGELREAGFGNVFPNYVVDIKKDGAGNYDEAIQFQCLDSGGVRVFEGINFLSRHQQLSPSDLEGMFRRAQAAGLGQYGALPEQMHLVPHSPNFQPVDNWWQQAWNAVGVDKLLKLIADSY
ncbi:hypothetical protein M885DRAFT_614466 [Pelagophyceae sp. CCMP2097]|nr:hypothetical protein M885DRAFT_614466 [Pelagophyceae sp. CCMP2097]